MTTVQAMLETIPPDSTGIDPGRQTRQVRVQAQTYEQARDQVMAELPHRWRVIWFRTA